MKPRVNSENGVLVTDSGTLEISQTTCRLLVAVGFEEIGAPTYKSYHLELVYAILALLLTQQTYSAYADWRPLSPLVKDALQRRSALGNDDNDDGGSGGVGGGGGDDKFAHLLAAHDSERDRFIGSLTVALATVAGLHFRSRVKPAQLALALIAGSGVGAFIGTPIVKLIPFGAYYSAWCE
jgi:hypothetical protein